MKYRIELNGRDSRNGVSSCQVFAEDGKLLGEATAILTEVALLRALYVARGSGHLVLREVYERLETAQIEEEMEP